MIIALDAMGGDHAPEQIVLGAAQAVAKYDCSIVLVGDRTKVMGVIDVAPDVKKEKVVIVGKDNPEETVSDVVGRLEGQSGWLIVQHASQVIEMGDHPVEAMRKKKDASLVVATRLVKEQVCDGVISAGSTGGATTMATIMFRKIKGIDKPAIATPIPTVEGVTLLLDSGAIVDTKPKDYAHMALMGSIYAEKIFKVSNPKVGLLNIGEEETKGNKTILATYPLLKKMTTVNFIGNVEGRDITHGTADVVICDGFVGNVVLKFAEGMAQSMFTLIKDAITEFGITAKLGALLVRPALMKLKKRMDVDEYGGAPLLGVNGCCIICHGSSNAKAICNAVGVAIEYVKNDVLARIKDSLEKEEMLANDSE